MNSPSASDAPLASALSSRATVAMAHSASADIAPTISPADPTIMSVVGRHLHDGETHYPVRPGMTELREAIDARLAVHGTSVRGPGAVLVCASAGEAAFVTLLGLDLVPGGTLWGELGSRHDALLAWTGVSVTDRDPGGSVPFVRDVGSALFGDERLGVRPDELLIGDLESLPIAPFDIGFVAGPPQLVASITKWKQASSICAPSPSQRAALTALGVGV